MGRIGGIFVGLVLLVYALNALPNAYNTLRQDVGLKSLPPPDISLSYSPPLIPVTVYVDANLRLTVSYDIEVKVRGVSFGYSVSPKPVRKLVVVLGQRAREYPIQGQVRIAIPNTLSGHTSIEWNNDIAVVTVPDPGNVKFPDE